MNKYFVAFASILLSLNCLAQNPKVQNLMERVNNRYVGDDAYSQVKFDYKSSSGRKKEMLFSMWNLETEEGNKTLLKYKEPSFMKNSGILIHGFDNRTNLQWLYLSRASKREPRKIPNSDKGNSLFGTDFFYVDIEKKSTSDFTYSYLGEEILNNEPLKKIQSIAKNKEYPYERTISWVDEKLNMEMKIEFYQQGKLSKTLRVNKIETISGIKTATKVTVDNHKRKTMTTMSLSNVKYNQALTSNSFNFKALTAKELNL